MSRSTEIPTRSRTIVDQRDQGRCLRCGGPANQKCHRRTRAVRDEHTHCPCNLWSGCNACHQEWQHANPEAALEQGFAVSRYEDEPGLVPINSWYGAIKLLCDGDVEFVIRGMEQRYGIASPDRHHPARDGLGVHPRQA